MFGYVTINKPEIRFKDYDMYRSYYCGLCHSLGDRYGLTGRMTLDYDMAFLILLLTGLYDTVTEEGEGRCIVHPLQKHRRRSNEFTAYAADMNLLLFYYKCLDDWEDEKKYTRRIYAAFLSRKVKGIAEKYPEKAEAVKTLLKRLSEEEKRQDADLDGTSGIFGEILAEIFVYRKNDVWENQLRQLGFFLGKFIYLADAYDDVEKDMEKGLFNPFAAMYGQPDFDEKCGSAMKMMISECSEIFERLPVTEHVEILRNIMYAGVWSRYEATLQKRKEKENV